MKRTVLSIPAFLTLVFACSASAESQYWIEAAPGHLSGILSRHGLILERVIREEGVEAVYEVSSAANSSATAIEAALKKDDDVNRFEANVKVAGPEVNSSNSLRPSLSALGSALTDRSTMSYFGAQVRSTYVNQPATSIIGLNPALVRFGAGNTVVAVIDTGVDPTHPALQSALVPGYDFTRDQPGASELADLSQSTVAILDQSSRASLNGKNTPIVLNQSTVAILDQSTVAILDGNNLPAAFGHGTMTAGLIHLVAPSVRIMPLKAFSADGSGTLFDIIRAIYYAVDHGAKVINMSFSMTAKSVEMTEAIRYALSKNVICVASAGNDGRETTVYPAGFDGVIGVASVDAQDNRSKFSNYGDHAAKTAAPGEAIITTYPGNNYAGVWGTSFSTAMVSGASALFAQLLPTLSPSKAKSALDHGHRIHQDCGEARLDVLASLIYCALSY